MNGINGIEKMLNDFTRVTIVRIFVIIIVALLLTKFIRWLLPKIADRLPSRFRLYILPLVPVLRLFILTLAIVLIIPLIINPTFQNLITILAAAGVAIGFAFKDYVSSLIAGVVAIYERPYRPGDWVEIDGAYGEVQSLDLRALRLRTPDDTMVTIPHKKIWDNNIYNANDGNRDLLCVADFYLHPDHDAEKVRRKLYDVALTSPYLNFDRCIVVIVFEKPWGTHYRLKAYPLDGRDQFLFITDLTVRGKSALMEMNVKPAHVLPAVVEDSTHRRAERRREENSRE